jgi:preprotein translocase subunit SecD
MVIRRRPAAVAVGCGRYGNGGVASAVAYPAGPGAVVGPARGWTVVVSFTAAGQTAFTDLTADTVGRRIAVVLDGVVWSAPTVDMRINGPAEVASDVDQAPARALAAVLSVGPLPVALTGSVVTSAVPPGFS